MPEVSSVLEKIDIREYIKELTHPPKNQLGLHRKIIKKTCDTVRRGDFFVANYF